MEYIHVRNLEKFHPGYRDRKLQWAKIFFDMVQGDPDCELIEDEIDWARLVKIIILELEAQQPLPNLDRYWKKKGFDVKKRPMSLTIKMLHNFLTIVTQNEKLCGLDKEKDKDKEKEEDKDIERRNGRPTIDEVRLYCKERNKGVDPEKWYNHYQANGWRVGRNPMKDWRAAVRTWEKNQPVFSKKQRPATLLVIEMRAQRIDDQDIKSHLLSEGYSEKEVDMALNAKL